MSTHEDWQAARERRNSAASMYVRLTTDACRLGDPLPADHPRAVQALEQYKAADAAMAAIEAELDAATAHNTYCNATRSSDKAAKHPCRRTAGHPGRHHDGQAKWGTL